MSLEERCDPVECGNLKGTPWQLKGPRKSGCETTHACRWRVHTSSDHSRNPWRYPLRRKLYVLRGDVERLGATDGCVAVTHLILGSRASVTHSARCTRRMQELSGKRTKWVV